LSISNKWVDPTTYADKETFYKAYTDAFAKAKVFQELIDLLASQEQRIKEITKRLERDEVDYAIGN
jgi:hypothetical protein